MMSDMLIGAIDEEDIEMKESIESVSSVPLHIDTTVLCYSPQDNSLTVSLSEELVGLAFDGTTFIVHKFGYDFYVMGIVGQVQRNPNAVDIKWSVPLYILSRRRKENENG